MSKLMYGISKTGETAPDAVIPERVSGRLLSRGSMAEDIVSDLVNELSPHQRFVYVTISDGKTLTVHEVRIVRTTNTYESLSLTRDITPPSLPAEIADAGWEYAESWDEAQPMGFTDWLNSREIRACMLVCTRRVVPMPKELEEPINKDVFVCWLKVKK